MEQLEALQWMWDIDNCGARLTSQAYGVGATFMPERADSDGAFWEQVESRGPGYSRYGNLLEYLVD